MIGNLLSRIARADDLNSVDALTASVRNGTIPAFIGVPMIAELVKNQKEAQALGQGMPTATVTDQVLQQAQALNQPQMPQQPMPEQMAMPQQPMPQQMAQQPPVQPAGIDAAQSNLPTQGMAAGGIVAFAKGDLVDDDDEDNEEYYADMAAKERMAEMIANQQSESNALTRAMLDAQGNYAGPNLGVVAAPSAGILSSLSMPKSYTAAKASANKGSGIDANATGASKGLKDDSFTSKIEHLESRGRDYDKYGNILTSPKGAMGRMQVMPNTSRDPGFGVIPAKDKSPEELARVGRDYANALKQYYKGDEKLAAMAYNWGPGRVNDWLAGGKKGKVPGETRQYASNFAEGGIVSLAAGGKVPGFSGGVYITDSAGNTRIPKPNYPMVPYQTPAAVQAAETLSPWERYIKPGLKALYGTPSAAAVANSPTKVHVGNKLLGSSVPGAVIAGGQYLGEKTMDTMAGNPYFEGYSDPFMGDVAVANAILNQNPGALEKAREYKVEKPVAPEVKVPVEKELDAYLPPEIKAETKGEEVKGEKELSPLQQAYNDYLKSQQKREAKLEKQETLGNYMAALQGFLGMMGGTSPYLFSNIGQGASSGITTLMNMQKLQGANERAFGRDQFGALQMQRLIEKDAEDRGLREKLGVAGLEEKYSDNIAAVNAKRSETLRKVLDDNQPLKYGYESARKKVEDAYKLGKTPDAADLSNYENYKNRMKELENQINKRLPLPSRPTILGANRPGVIKLD
jgi:hypothetical protein